jgi:hypothetical protein
MLCGGAGSAKLKSTHKRKKLTTTMKKLSILSVFGKLALSIIPTGLICAQTQQPPSQKSVSTSQAAEQVMVGAFPSSQSLLPEGTPVRMRINRTVSSADAQVNDNVDFETLDDVKLGEIVVIPKGSTAIGTITEAVPKRRMARGGKLGINIDYVRMPSGERLALRGVQDVKGGGHTGAMTGGMVATAIVFFPAAPFFLFMHGKDITIPKGHEVTVYTNSDYSLPKAVTTTAKPASQVFGQALTNAEIMKMKEAGLGDQLIIAKIKSSPGKYKLDTDELIALKKAGVSEEVIAAMLQARQN